MKFEKWLTEMIRWVDVHLNWMDLLTFLFGAILILIGSLFFLGRKKKHYEEKLTAFAVRYEDILSQLKASHMLEIHHAEEKILTFKTALELVQSEYERGVAKLEKKYHKKHEEEISHRDLSIFKLKKEMTRVRAQELAYVNQFEEEVKRLKREIETLHQNHIKEIELAESEIMDLRKQMQALIEKV